MQFTKSTLAAGMIKGAVMAAVLLLAIGAFAATKVTYTESVIYPFQSSQSNPDGEYPSCNGMIMDKTGNIYGTTPADGGTDALNPDGVVFKLSPVTGGGWTETILFVFNRLGTGYSGYNPCGTLAFDSKGNLYGTTVQGGDPSVCVSPSGNFGCGTVYELSPPKTGTGYWTPTLIYSFTGGSADGFWPTTGVTLGNSAATLLYGTTVCGGTGVLLDMGDQCEYNGTPIGAGSVYKLAYTKPTKTNKGGWKETVLLEFAGNESSTSGANVGGFTPASGLLLKKGNLYGSTQSGGEGGSGGGVVYELQPGASGWTEDVLYNFCSQAKCADSGNPMHGTPVMDSKGNLYGTGNGGGAFGNGAVWELVYSPTTNTYTEQVLYSFGTNPNDGTHPSWGVVPYKNGWVGTTGGWQGLTCGTAFELTYSAKTGWHETNLWQFGGQTDVCLVGFNQLIVDKSGNFYGMGYEDAAAGGGPGGVFEISPK